MQSAAKLSPGTCIIVELVDGDCYSGDLVFLAPDFRQITIENVKEHKTGDSIDGNQIYYQSEVKSIRTLSGQTNETDNEFGIELSGTVAPRTIRKAELEWIWDVVRHPVYIKQCDMEYHKAIKMLGGHDFVGFAMESVRFGRQLPVSLLVFSTPTNIFIFDIVLYGRLFPELKTILEAPVPRKIVFDSRFMTDSLTNRYGLGLNGVVDLTVIFFF